jgi:hypothetical protein
MSIRRGVRVAAKEAMQRFNYDPLESLVLFAQDAGTNNDTKMHIAEVLLPYMYPKLSNVTVEGEIVSNTSAESQAALLRRVLDNPELADAAQRLSLAAAEAALESEDVIFGGSASTIQ